jgi:hypothetical protein
VHANIAGVFERKAKDHETVALKGGAEIHNGRVVLPPLRKSQRSELTLVQFPYDANINLGNDPDCLCKVLLLEGCLLAMLCATGVLAELCPIAALVLALEKLLEALGLCQPSRCF